MPCAPTKGYLNPVFRCDPRCAVIGFTATQIPFVSGRRYPAALAGPLCPAGIPISSELEIERLIKECGAEQSVFAYSDVSIQDVMHLAAPVVACGADFRLLGAAPTMLRAADVQSLPGPARRPSVLG